MIHFKISIKGNVSVPDGRLMFAALVAVLVTILACFGVDASELIEFAGEVLTSN